MRHKLVLLIFLVFSFSSCDTFFHAKGTVVDDDTSQPIANAIVQVKGKDIFHTDSLGYYKVDKSFLGVSVKVEMMVSKDGYRPVFVDCSKPSFKHEQEIIRMKKASTPFVPRFPQSMVRVMYLFNLVVISLFNVFTLLFVIFKRGLKNKLLWIIAILFLNTTMHLLYLDGSIVHFSLLNGPVYIAHYWTYPYTLKIVFPLASLFFWIMYLFSRDSITRLTAPK